MKIKLTTVQYEYLKNKLMDSDPKLYKQIFLIDLNNHFYIEADENIIDELRDWAGEQLQLYGFDPEYDLTKEGEILEDLIDLFYISN